MLRKSESNEVDERRLFHGTSHKNIRSICHDNFDWRLSGEVTGDIYGKGTYFARDASFSHCYCHDDEDGIRYVFVAKVLVGSYTKGDKEHRLPPLKNPDNPHSDRYDSCVDNVDNPQVFVVSNNDQYYPEYIIEYTSESLMDQASPSHKQSDPMVTPYTDQGGIAMATSASTSPDPYSQYYGDQAAYMATASSSPYFDQYLSVGSYPTGQVAPAYLLSQRDRYSVDSYSIGQAAPTATAYSPPQHDRYSVGSYPIGQAASTPRPSSSNQEDLDPLLDQIIDVGASTARYLARTSSASAASSSPRSVDYSRSTSVPSYSSSNPGSHYPSRSSSGQLPRHASYSHGAPDVRPGGQPVKKNEGCSVM